MNFILIEEEQSETSFIHLSAILMAVDLLEELLAHLTVNARQLRDRIWVAVVVAPWVYMIPTESQRKCKSVPLKKNHVKVSLLPEPEPT